MRIPQKHILYSYLLYMCANETAMHQPKALHYIATVYTMKIFQCSFVSLSSVKIPTVFSNACFLVAFFNAVLFSAGSYWNVSSALSEVLLYGCCSIVYWIKALKFIHCNEKSLLSRTLKAILANGSLSKENTHGLME